MRTRLLSLFLALAVAGLVGCTAAKQTPEQLQARLEAAIQISDDQARDKALARLADDAAQSEAADLCVQAVDLIGDDLTHDATVQACVAKLNSPELRPAAEALVNRIGQNQVRDRLLCLLANSPPRPSQPSGSSK